jgi:hypothetical protein
MPTTTASGARQMTLLPDWGKQFKYERSASFSAGLGLSRACDLMLYPELGKPGRAVLVVRMIAAMTYEDGQGPSGATLAWTASEKTQFAADLHTAVNDVWAEKHRITTTSKLLNFSDVGVIFDLKFTEDLSKLDHSHRNITVTKTAGTPRSTTSNWWLTLGRNNPAHWWSNGTTPFAKGASHPQRAVVHEFGHVLGYRDEYLGSNNTNLTWLKDFDSVMHSGEMVRDRHYALLADWLTRQHAYFSQIMKQTIEFKVNGVTTILTAKL